MIFIYAFFLPNSVNYDFIFTNNCILKFNILLQFKNEQFGKYALERNEVIKAKLKFVMTFYANPPKIIKHALFYFFRVNLK